MINILCANPCIDKIYILDDFTEGTMQRSENVSITPGGKGINVAKVLKCYGTETNLYGFYSGFSGRWLISMLESLNIKNSLTLANGETRTTINIINRKNSSETELLESSLFVSNTICKKFLSIIEKNIVQNSTFVISGSLPNGLDSHFYISLVEVLNKKNVKVILDTSEENLLDTLVAKPYLIKPNLRELAFISKMDLHNEHDIKNALDYLVGTYDIKILLSMGANGAIYKSKENSLLITHPKIDVINTIGSGDSLTAGLAYGIDIDLPLKDIIRLSIAMAVSNTQFQEIGLIDSTFVEDFKNKITIEQF